MPTGSKYVAWRLIILLEISFLWWISTFEEYARIPEHTFKLGLCHSTVNVVTSYIVSQHIERDQLSPNIKIDFLLFPKWLFFHLNFGAKNFEIRHCSLEIWQIYWGCHDILVNSWFWEKGSFKFGNLYKVLVFW